MKKIFLSVVMSALFLIGSLSMISMAPPPPDNSQCKQLAIEFAPIIAELGLSKGEVMGACNTCFNKAADNSTSKSVCACKIFKIAAGALGEENENFGKCVTTIEGFDFPFPE